MLSPKLSIAVAILNYLVAVSIDFLVVDSGRRGSWLHSIQCRTIGN